VATMKVYKYLKEKRHYDEWLSGKIIFSPWNYYLSIEDKIRQDDTEFADGFGINTKQETNFTVNINGITMLENDAIEFVARYDESHDSLRSIWISCFSEDYSKNLMEHFEAKYVIEFDVEPVIEIMEYQIKGKFKFGKVKYDNLYLITNPNFDRGFIKPKQFAHEKEWRIFIQNLNQMYCINNTHIPIEFKLKATFHSLSFSKPLPSP